MAHQRLTLPQALGRAFSAYNARNLGEAEKICRQILSAKPDLLDALHLLAVVQAARGENELALASYDRTLSVRPDYAEALNNRGATLYAMRRLEEALASYDCALELRPDYAAAFNNRGVTLYEMKRLEEALASYDRALSFRADYAEALNNRGNTLRDMKRPSEALASYDRALELRPDYPEALYNRGNILKDLERYEEALASYDRTLSLRPNFPEALTNRGVALHEMNRYDEALASYDLALRLQPNYAEALYNRGLSLQELKRLDEALESYDRALALKPDHVKALYNRGNALQELDRLDEALASYDRALALRPDYADALNNRGLTLNVLQRHDEALASYDRALAADAHHEHVLGGAADCVIKLCDFDRRTRLASDLVTHIADKKSIVSPFVLLGYGGDPALQLQCAQSFLMDRIPVPPEPLWRGAVFRHDRIRIAYLSPDFREHPVGHLSAELFELHDRNRFEVIGLSYGRDDLSETRARIAKAFDAFHDIRSKSDREAAKRLNDLEVDIAVDMAGHTRDNRIGIFAYRPAPIQASYLGFPATTGADFIDYIIADKIVAPFEDQKFYAEQIVHLPDSYLVSDRRRGIAERAPTRAEAGLPEHGLVFCCFNNSWKIAPPVFDVWMRLLDRAEGSVLWLAHTNNSAMRNLYHEAEARGIDASRLIFAPRLRRLDDHLARHRLADLFLDTLPYNAHTTASDALWVGLPVLTCSGEAFAGRVAASLLEAIGLPELIAANLEEYEAIGLRLARDRALLAEIKAKLARHRETYPLFDTPRFVRHIESAYTTMWETWQRGDPPRGFSVEPSGKAR